MRKTLAEVAGTIRSKNAGPFWVTIDIFFDDATTFLKASSALASATVADVLQTDENELKRFDLADIFVVKFSFPRSVVQGSRFDRDMHGAQYANLLAGIEIELEP